MASSLPLIAAEDPRPALSVTVWKSIGPQHDQLGAGLDPAKYSWRSRSIEYHRAQIRKAIGTRPATEADEEQTLGGVACGGVLPGGDDASAASVGIAAEVPY
jgi:hypothetical protein